MDFKKGCTILCHNKYHNHFQDLTQGTKNTTLYVDSNNRLPPSEVIDDFNQITSDSSRTWLTDLDANVTFDIDTLTLIRGAHLAVHPDIQQ